MSKDFISRLKSGELVPVDLCPAVDSDEEVQITKVSKKQMNSKEPVVIKPKTSTTLTPKQIKDGDYTIKQIIEAKPSKAALKEWLRIRIMELTMSDDEEDDE